MYQRIDKKCGQWWESGTDVAYYMSMAIVYDVIDLDLRVVCDEPDQRWSRFRVEWVAKDFI